VIADFGISIGLPALAASVGLTATYGFYAVAAFISLFFVRALVHETRGHELKDMVG
jgi:SP family sugar:H+ symporter-like MFS transporter